MTRIVFIDHTGHETTVDASNGLSIMEVAVSHDIRGIVAECGGACACATCHVFVDDIFRDLAGEPGELESAMLEFTDGRRQNSRLACQIEVRAELDGVRVTMPESQI